MNKLRYFSLFSRTLAPSRFPRPHDDRYFSLFSGTLAPSRFPRPHDAVLVFAMFPYSSAATVVSAGSSTGKHMFMAQYLVESCGFDQEKAADVSKLLRGIKSRQQPDSVLAFLKSYGFNDQTVKSIIVFFPQCLLLDVEKSVAPKFQLLQDLGLSRSDVAHLIWSNPIVLKSRFETILPKIHFWQKLLGSNDSLVKLFAHNRWFLRYWGDKRVQPNLENLQECRVAGIGASGQKFTYIVKSQPVIVLKRHDSLKSVFLGVDLRLQWSSEIDCPLRAISIIKPNKFIMQLELFRGFGWSVEDFIAAFQKCPTFPTRSLKSLQRKMEFFVK